MQLNPLDSEQPVCVLHWNNWKKMFPFLVFYIGIKTIL